MNAFETVLEKAKTDQEFAQKLFFAPVEACSSAGIALNDNQQKLLHRSIDRVIAYCFEQLFLLTVDSDVLCNGQCNHCNSQHVR